MLVQMSRLAATLLALLLTFPAAAQQSTPVPQVPILNNALTGGAGGTGMTTDGRNATAGALGAITLTAGVYALSAGNVSVLPSLYNATNGQVSNLNNTALGVGTLSNLVNAPNNTAIGWSALTALSSGDDETAVGARSLKSDVSGTFNTAVGSDTLRYLVSGQGNIALGHGAMAGSDTVPQNLTGSYNTALGNWSFQQLYGNHSGNTGVGMDAGSYITTGEGNVAVGLTALAGCALSGCTSAIADTITASQNTALGYSTLMHNMADGQVAVGYKAMLSNQTGTLSTAVGYNALQTSVADVRNTVVGYNSANTLNGGGDNTAVGEFSLGAATTGGFNTVIGSNAGNKITSGGGNVAIGGYVASTVLTTGSNNIFIGTSSNCDADSAGSNSTFKLCASSGATPLMSGNLAAGSLALTVNGSLTTNEVLGTVTTQSGTTYTFAASDCGTEVTFSNGSAVTATIPATLPAGCNIAVAQLGAGKVSVNGSAVSAATLHSAHSYTATFGQWAVIGINIEANSGGSAAIALLSGDGS